MYASNQTTNGENMLLIVKGKYAKVSTVGAYLPENYSVTGGTDGEVIVEGKDNAGWTAEGYVIPRLRSGMMYATIVERSYMDCVSNLELDTF
jgi:hypothetical protein